MIEKAGCSISGRPVRRWRPSRPGWVIASCGRRGQGFTPCWKKIGARGCAAFRNRMLPEPATARKPSPVPRVLPVPAFSAHDLRLAMEILQHLPVVVEKHPAAAEMPRSRGGNRRRIGLQRERADLFHRQLCEFEATCANRILLPRPRCVARREIFLAHGRTVAEPECLAARDWGMSGSSGTDTG